MRERVDWLLEGLHDRGDGQAQSPQDQKQANRSEPGSQARPLRPPRRSAEPERQEVEERKREHTARYFGTDRLRVDGETGGAA